MSKGFIYSGQHDLEISVTEQALKLIKMQDSTVRFASSGTEIVELAIRLIRIYTGKNKFIKFRAITMVGQIMYFFQLIQN